MISQDVCEESANTINYWSFTHRLIILLAEQNLFEGSHTQEFIKVQFVGSTFGSKPKTFLCCCPVSAIGIVVPFDKERL